MSEQYEVGPLDADVCALCFQPIRQLQKVRAKQAEQKVPPFWCRDCVAAYPEILEGVPWARALQRLEDNRRKLRQRAHEYAEQWPRIPVEWLTLAALLASQAGAEW